MTSALVDRFHRQATTLRLSITDRCNMACTYCVPPEGVVLKKACDLMTDDEVLRMAGVFVSLGVEKIRLTGGEPLVRRSVVDIARRLKALPGLKTLAVSTNGLLLENKVEALKDAGVTAVNVSLDTFGPAAFREITGGGNVLRVMGGIKLASRLGMKVRVNAVALRSTTDEDLKQFLELARCEDLEVRFLEYMPLCGDSWNKDDFLPYKELLARIEQFSPLAPEPYHPREKARYYTLPGARGKVGVIASITASFCSDCSRIRLSSAGRIRACLFSAEEIDLLTPLRRGASDEDLAAMIQTVVWNKPAGHGVNPDRLEDVQPLAQGLIRTIGG